MALYLGIDLAWGLGATKPANETGLCALDASGRILDAGWARGPAAVDEWVGAMIDEHRPGAAESFAQARSAKGDGATGGPTSDSTVVIAIDAPLIVPNASGMRECEREVARGYGRYKVGANASNQALASKAGEVLLELLERRRVAYTDGTRAAAPGEAVAFECYPYTTLVGCAEFGYDVERPRYKRLDTTIPGAEARARRAAATDELIHRIMHLRGATPPLDLASHPATAELGTTPTPVRGEKERKHREDLLDAALCAWTAALWHQHGGSRTQSLGTLDRDRADVDERGRVAAIVAPYRGGQFRGSRPI